MRLIEAFSKVKPTSGERAGASGRTFQRYRPLTFFLTILGNIINSFSNTAVPLNVTGKRIKQVICSNKLFFIEDLSTSSLVKECFVIKT